MTATACRLTLVVLAVTSACTGTPTSAPISPTVGSCEGSAVADGVAPTWSRSAPLHSPPARAAAAMAFDERRGEVVLFGGRAGARLLGDTWTWDGRTWTEQRPSSRPPPRDRAGLTSDPAGRLVLFGGLGQGAVAEASLGDTWTWDGHDWTEQHPSQSPQAGAVNVMASGGSRGAILFGTWEPFSHQGDWQTWQWDGQQWTVLLTNVDIKPTNGVELGNASRDDDGSILYFGGRDPRGAIDQTWRLTGQGWSQLRPSAAPPARYAAGFAYVGGGTALMFGGHGLTTPTLGDTWSWSGGQWTQVRPGASPSARTGQAMVFDGARRQVLLFGGVAIASDFTETPLCDTWVWRP